MFSFSTLFEQSIDGRVRLTISASSSGILTSSSLISVSLINLMSLLSLMRLRPSVQLSMTKIVAEYTFDVGMRSAQHFDIETSRPRLTHPFPRPLFLVTGGMCPTCLLLRGSSADERYVLIPSRRAVSSSDPVNVQSLFNDALDECFARWPGHVCVLLVDLLSVTEQSDPLPAIRVAQTQPVRNIMQKKFGCGHAGSAGTIEKKFLPANSMNDTNDNRLLSTLRTVEEPRATIPALLPDQRLITHPFVANCTRHVGVRILPRQSDQLLPK